MKAFGATGTDDGCDLRDVKLYYVSPDEAVSCIDTFSVIYGFGGIYPAMNWNPVMDAGGAKFLNIGGACEPQPMDAPVVRIDDGRAERMG